MEDALRIGLSISLFTLTLVSSCSWYKNLEKSLVEDDVRQARKKQVVPREKDDQLLVKYEELSKKYEDATRKGEAPSSTSLVDEIQATSVSTETVDLFGSAPNSAPQTPVVDSQATIVVPRGLEDQVSLFRRGVILRQTNQGEATKIFQELELKSTPAIAVRAKQQIGEMLFEKGQFDLALQVFEDIISRYSHSGVVLDALRYSITCADKLGIVSKKEQYASILNDVFESR